MAAGPDVKIPPIPVPFVSVSGMYAALAAHYAAQPAQVPYGGSDPQ